MDTVIVIGARQHRQRRDWLTLLGGIVAILVGAFLFVQPARTTIAVLQVFAAVWLIEATIQAIESVLYRPRGWGWHLLVAAMGVSVAALILAQPMLVTLIAVTTLYTAAIILMSVFGVFWILVGLSRDRRWAYVLVGILQLLMAILLVLYPQAGVLFVVQMIALVPLILGLLLVLTSWFMPRPEGENQHA
ncbi:MAG: DUF308 domain-containing protein [Chloroflexi bacterium]|nr:DUF308 domain-containing protein [Chloroflexota bacterium]